ncbi:hypothetical protein SB861_68425, partial [Paraburkholderia sp. SIMBA_049]
LDAQRFNFSDLIDKFSKPSEKPSSKPAEFSVSNIRVENGQITFDDRLLDRRRRPRDVAFLDDGEAADRVVVEVDVDRA